MPVFRKASAYNYMKSIQVKLRVSPAIKEEIYRDFARIPEAARKIDVNQYLPEGKVYKISVQSRTDVKSKSTYVILRGERESQENIIRLDEKKREELGVGLGEEVNFVIKSIPIWGSIQWARKHSDVAYRVTTYLAIWSLVLGITGFISGIIASCK